MNKKYSKKVALLTGATGFVGSNLVRKLINEGWEVHALIRTGSCIESLNDFKDRLYTYPIINDAKRLSDILINIQPECVFHIASLFISQHKPEQLEDLIESNVTFPTILLEAMHIANIRRLVNTGTSWQHYENESYNPVNLYAATKQAFEAIVKYYIDAHQFSVCTLKLFDTYGPNDPRPKLIPILYKCATEGTALEMSPGDQMMDLVHIDDVVEAYYLAAKMINSHGPGERCYGVSSNLPIKLRDLIKIFEEISGQNLNVKLGALPYRKREVMKLWRSFDPVPNWMPKVPLELGIKGLFNLPVK